jgi:hypothetical protein
MFRPNLFEGIRNVKSPLWMTRVSSPGERSIVREEPTRTNKFEVVPELVLCSVPRTNLFVRVVLSPAIECSQGQVKL